MTKRAQRIKECLPDDWGDGWDNVTFSVSCENQKRLDERMPYLLEIPSKHKWVSLKPFIGEIEIDKYLATGQIEVVLAGGENHLGSRPLHNEWAKKIYDDCVKYSVQLILGQTGNFFITDGKERKIHNRIEQMVEALRSSLNYPPKDIEREVAVIYVRKEAIAKTRKKK